MAPRAKAPTKGQVKAAADRAEERSALKRRSAPKARATPSAESSVQRPEAVAGAGGVTRMIAVGPLKNLMRAVLGYQEEVSTASGKIGDEVRDAAANKHLHRGAFADMKKLYRMGKKDAGKLWLHLAHFDDMRKKLGLDEIAATQGQLLDAGTSEDDGEAEEPDGQPQAPGATVSRPKFGAGHKNFGEGHKQVIKDAAAAGAVQDIAKAAGANTPG